MTTHAHTRSNWAAGLDAKRKLQEIAARDLGGAPDEYDVGDARVFRKSNRSVGMTFARAAERAIQLGGRYDGHELPEDINAVTKASAAGLAKNATTSATFMPVGSRPSAVWVAANAAR